MDETGEPRVVGLPFAAQFLLWSLRTWAAAAAAGQPLPEHLPAALAAARVPEALLDLDAALTLITAGSLRPLALRCPRCAWAGADELQLLAVAEALQRHDEAAARSLLAPLLPPAVVRLTLPPWARLAARLAAVGLRLASPPAPAPRPAEVLPFPDRGLRLLQ